MRGAISRGLFPSPLRGGVRGGGGPEWSGFADAARRRTSRAVLNHPHPYPPRKGEGDGRRRATACIASSRTAEGRAGIAYRAEFSSLVPALSRDPDALTAALKTGPLVRGFGRLCGSRSRLKAGTRARRATTKSTVSRDLFPSPLRGGARGGVGSEWSAFADAARRRTSRAVLDLPHPYPPHKGEGDGRRRAIAASRFTNSPLMTFPTESLGKTASLTQGEAE